MREYLYPIAANRLRGLTLPGFLQKRHEALWLLITTGFLPQRFRDEMQLPWDPQRQRRFDRLMGVLRTVNNLLPGFLRRFPFNVLLKDLDWRVRTGGRWFSPGASERTRVVALATPRAVTSPVFA